MALWTAKDVAIATNGEIQSDFDINGLSIDSREIAKGDLFIALKAARDGHEFVKMAIEKGAAGALVSHIPEGCDALPLIVVNDVEAALADMGKSRRAKVKARIVAVTGSAGKTSTKEMLRTALFAFGKTHASVKSFNNHWGVPLTLARMPLDSEFAVFEIGMNAPGEIEPLVKMVVPEVSIITNIAPVHLAGFDDESGIAREKAAILSGLAKNGVGVVYGDMAHFDFVKSQSQHPIISFGRNANNDYQLIDEGLDDAGSYGVIVHDDLSQSFSIRAHGHHHLQNLLAVVAVADRFGLDRAQLAEAMAEWDAADGRGQRMQIAGLTIVDESYNANPLSMKAAIDAFMTMDAPRKTLILGDMLELGPRSSEFHRAIANQIDVNAIAQIVTIGTEMQALAEVLPVEKRRHFADVAQFESEMMAVFAASDAVLLKASNGIGLGKIVDAVQKIGQSGGNFVNKT